MSEIASLSVSQAIALCNEAFDPLLLVVEGEVANFSISRGTYVFFDLKDEQVEARVSCFMMRYQLQVPIENGMRIRVTAKPGLYSKSGQFRLTVRRIEPVGQGSLQRAFELLKQKLAAEGLFAPERKRSLPRLPRHVAIISSSDAAGYTDFLKVAGTRMQGVHFSFISVAVQGVLAETEICAALEQCNELPNLEVIVLIRGGGSMEDLHAFNSEPVARAIARSRVPVVTGIGHERDTTIADFCADVRAATPSSAAQILLPTTEEVHDQIIRLVQQGRLRTLRLINDQQSHVRESLSRQKATLARIISIYRADTERRVATIAALSPQATLARGYSITSRLNGTIITSSEEVKPGEELTTTLRKGRINAIVTEPHE